MDPRPTITINGHCLAALPQFTEWQRVVIACPSSINGSEVTLRVGADELGPPSLQHGDPTWRWQWNSENKSGRFRAVLAVDGQEWPWALEVVPSKLSIEHYHRLLQAVEETALDLLLALGGGEIGAASSPTSAQSLLAQWPQLQAQAAQAVELVGRIAQRPHQTQQRQSSSLPLYELHEPDSSLLASLTNGPLDHIPADRLPGLPSTLHAPGGVSGHLLPQQIRTVRSTTTTDCIEHRVLRTVVDRLAQRVSTLR